MSRVVMLFGAAAVTRAIYLFTYHPPLESYYLRLALPGRSGINLYIGNSPYTAALLPTYDLDLLQPEGYKRFVSAHPDIADDAPRFDVAFADFLTHVAVQHMAEDPVRTIRQKLINITYLFSPLIVPLRISSRDTRVLIDGNGAARVVDSVPRRRSEIVAHAVTSTVLLVGCAWCTFRRRATPHRCSLC